MLLVFEIIVWLLVIIACVLLVMAVRKIPVQYARRTATGDYEQDMLGGNRQWIPLKLNASGVMPIIFAQAIMFIPAAVSGLAKESDTALSIAGMFNDPFGLVYNICYKMIGPDLISEYKIMKVYFLLSKEYNHNKLVYLLKSAIKSINKLGVYLTKSHV